MMMSSYSTFYYIDFCVIFMNDKKITINGIDIIHRMKDRKYDNQHLIVVFSGFGANGFFTYDFENALSECPANIIWIKDDFNSCCSYYCSLDNDLSISDSIFNFIELKLNELSLEREQCTLIGFSKGGFASLYFGVKYGFKNIISTVPQFNIGTYVKKTGLWWLII